MYPFQTAFIALEIPRDSHGNTDFHDFGRLDTGKAEAQPTGRTVYGNAGNFDANQQQYADDINRQSNFGSRLRLEYGNNP